MTIREIMLPEFDQEMANTRKLLERVPEDKLAWKPHEKSMPMGRLAGHVAELPSWAVNCIRLDSLDLNPGPGGEFRPTVMESRHQLLETFDKNVSEARELLGGASDEHLQKVWSLSFAGRKVMSMPRVAVLRNFVMNHLIHHRAQLGVYLRLNNVAIPGMYGPSADEPQTFGAREAAS